MSDRGSIPALFPPGPLRIGLFGGTFDPVHMAHLCVAEEVYRTFSLSWLEFLPSRTPPHKTTRRITDIFHRLEMLQRALSGTPHFRISVEEARREGPSYLVDTLQSYRAKYPPDGFLLFFVMGMDSYREISTWHEYPRLFALSEFVVISRPGYPRPRLEDAVSPDVACLFTLCPDTPNCLVHESGHRVWFCEDLSLELSSAQVRELLHQGKQPRELVPEPVLAYIRENNLYLHP